MCIGLISRSALPQRGGAEDAGAADLHQTLPRRSPMSAERRSRYSELPSKVRRLRIPLGTHSTSYSSILAEQETKRAQPNPSRLTECRLPVAHLEPQTDPDSERPQRSSSYVTDFNQAFAPRSHELGRCVPLPGHPRFPLSAPFIARCCWLWPRVAHKSLGPPGLGLGRGSTHPPEAGCLGGWQLMCVPRGQTSNAQLA
jgi:hypothetical protein